MRRHTAHASPNTRPVMVQSVHPLEHALQEHRLKLELQHGEMRGTQIERAAARNRHMDRYPLAPVGYFTLDAPGCGVGA